MDHPKSSKTEQREQETYKDKGQQEETEEEEEEAKEQQQKMEEAEKQQQNMKEAEEQQQKMKGAEEQQQKVDKVEEQQQQMEGAEEQQQKMKGVEEQQQEMKEKEDQHQKMRRAQEQEQEMEEKEDQQQKSEEELERQRKIEEKRKQQKIEEEDESETREETSGNHHMISTSGLETNCKESPCTSLSCTNVCCESKTPSSIVVLKREDLPASYMNNTSKEGKLVIVAERFCKQYAHSFPDRQPLFILPLNDCGVKKIVSTYIRKTLLPYIETYSWCGCARFVADYIHYIPLYPPTSLPKTMLSPSTVLRYQQGNCFELSTLLCSFLLGAGYKALVVSGYATKQTCVKDVSRRLCPITSAGNIVEESQPHTSNVKYTVKPPRHLVSKFETEISTRNEYAIEQEEREKLQEEINRKEEEEKLSSDHLLGMRIHSWVLVLPGSRDVSEAFFIEAATGEKKGVNDSEYLGIESLWNDKNYWINMQMCDEGCKNISYDLYNPVHWEFLLISEALQAPHSDDQLEEDLQQNICSKYPDMPSSWVEALKISRHDFDNRYPSSRKASHYYKSRVEEFAPYSVADGLIKRIIMYKDFACTEVEVTKEYFTHRKDKLTYRERSQTSGHSREKFGKGREKALKELRYKAFSGNVEDFQLMTYYHKARQDGLESREVKSANCIIEKFVGRFDLLLERVVTFGTVEKRFGPATITRRPILKIKEKLERNLEKPADENIAEREFDLKEGKISIVLHKTSGKVSASRREFLKPFSDDQASLVPLLEDATHGFDVDPNAPNPRLLEVYRQLKTLMEAEDRSVALVREAEDEINQLMGERIQEETSQELDTDLFSVDKTESVRKERKAFEISLPQQKNKLAEEALDPLLPHLAKIGKPLEELDQAHLFLLKEECLLDLRQRLIDRANRLQAKFEKETELFREKQLWYVANQGGLTEQDEDVYLSYCRNTMFKLHILELAMDRHKETAPLKYFALETRLNNDPRLVPVNGHLG